MAGLKNLQSLYLEELKQRRDEGVDLTAFQAAHPEVPEDIEALEALYDELMALPISPDFPYQEPSDYAGILAARPAPVEVAKKDIPYDKYYGAWMGRCIGCALGKPVETGWAFGGKNGVPGCKLVYEWFKGADAFPIKGYTPTHSRAEAEYDIHPNSTSLRSSRESIAYMESDDDIRYTVLGTKILREKGRDFTTWDVAMTWINELPFNMVWTAERQTYINLPHAINMVEDGYTKEEALDYARMYRNPYREWIGAQIRADGFAYAAAGDPELAADYAWRDASLSHVKNGIYGEMLFGAMIAAAFVETDPYKLVEIGLSKIPANCRLAHDVRDAIAIEEACNDQLELVEKIWERYCHYDGVHTINNACLCVAAILFACRTGKDAGDIFERAITTAVLGGWDTDCNGATVGSLMGAMLGEKAIPDYWKEPLHDTLNSNIIEYHPIAISECAKQSMH